MASGFDVGNPSGGNGNGLLDGGDGLDCLVGGFGTFVFHAATAYNNIDVVTDFSAGSGNKLDLRLLPDLRPRRRHPYRMGPDYGRGGNRTVEVDRDGTGSGYGWAQIATLPSVTGLTDEAVLVTNGNLIVS